jgi:LysM repeat protein
MRYWIFGILVLSLISCTPMLNFLNRSESSSNQPIASITPLRDTAIISTLPTNTPLIAPTVFVPTRTPIPTSVNSTACVPNTTWAFTYAVVRGDTLSNIARRANVTLNQLAQANCLQNVNIINVGQVLRVPNNLSAVVVPLTPTFTAVLTTNGQRIVSFTSNILTVDANSNAPLTLSWEAVGGAYVALDWKDRNGVQTMIRNLPLRGTFNINTKDITVSSANLLEIRLTVWNSNNTPVYQVGSSSEQLGRWLQIPVTSSLLQINNFSVNNPNPVSGQTITFSWQATGAVTAQVSFFGGRFTTFSDLYTGATATNGSYIVPINSSPQALIFTLQVTDVNGASIQQHITVNISCAFSSYIAVDCPAEQTTENFVSQRYERGWMVWRANTREIFIMQDNGALAIYTDTYTTGEALNIPTPPSGLIQPANGFGKVWQNNPSIQEALGWATGGETAFTSVFETVRSATVFGSRYFTLSNGSIIELPLMGGWRIR